ncbi:MAG TPA: hypothetical protein VF762_00150, partial [Blastocatellia bacterium]
DQNRKVETTDRAARIALYEVIKRALPAENAEGYLLRKGAVFARKARPGQRRYERGGIGAFGLDAAQYIERGTSGRAY